MRIILLFIFCIPFFVKGQTNTFPSSGNVGIGTTNPQAKLHLNNGAFMGSDPSYNNINVRIDGTSIPALKFTRWTGSASIQHNAFAGQFHNSSLGGEYSFGIGTGTSSSGDQDATSMVITTTLGGKVGIGTTTPRSRLDVGTSLQGGMLGAVLGRLPEGDGTGEGTFLGVRGYESQWTEYGGKSFALEHSFYGATNSSINFFRGSGVTGGYITFNTDQNIEKIRITTNGNVGIGTSSPQSKLTVAGDIHSQKVKVTINAGADFVFEEDYDLRRLDDLQKYIQQHKHLPEIPSAKEMETKGIELGEMNIKLLQKIEELTLYMIEQNKKLAQQSQELKILKEKVEKVLSASITE